MIDRTTRIALWAEVHRSIADSAMSAVESLGGSTCMPKTLYPPNDGALTAQEAAALQNLVLSDTERSALRKIIQSAASTPFFHFCCLLDGVADPPPAFNGATVFEGVWVGLSLAPKSSEEHEEMLHDEFYDSYWEYKRARA